MLPDDLYTFMAWLGSIWIFLCVVLGTAVSVILLFLKGREYFGVLKFYEHRKQIAMHSIVKEELFWAKKHEPTKHDSTPSQ